MEQVPNYSAFAPLAASAQELRAAVEGQVMLPDDPRYQEARLGWNRKVVQHPAIIVSAQSAEDVATAVKFARRYNLSVAVQGTGHNYIRPADDCLLILTREMLDVEIYPFVRTARVEAGVKWGAVLAAAQMHGLAPLLGSSPTVGVVGYTLGGGLGWLGRKYGLSADNVVSYEIVTADGQQRLASASENPELYWGLRGGGGSLGIVTALTIRLFPVTQVYAGNLYYPASMARDVFRLYRDWIATAPDELTTSVLLMNFPPIPALPDFLRGQSFAIVRGCYAGDAQDGEAYLRHWREWQPPQLDDFKTIPFSDAAIISNDPVDPMPGFNTGAWLRALSDEAIDTIISYALGSDGPPPLAFAEIRHAGGAIRRVAAETAVYGNRDAELLLNLVGVTPTEAAHQYLVNYTDRLKEALRPWLTGGVYMNFLEGVESQQRIRDGLTAGGYERLSLLKGRIDPENIFSHSFNVAPKMD